MKDGQTLIKYLPFNGVYFKCIYVIQLLQNKIIYRIKNLSKKMLIKKNWLKIRENFCN